MLSYSHPINADIPAIVDLWNQSFGPHWPLTERLLRQTMECDPYYEPEGCWLARVGEQPVGWVLCKTMRDAGPEVGRFQRRGGIGALCVAPSWRRRGIAGQLLDRAEAHLGSYGIVPTTLYYPHHLLPGIPADCEAAVALFRERGYRGFTECADLSCDLRGFIMPAKAAAALAANPGCTFRPAAAAEAPQLIAFVETEFPGGWTYSTRSHFARGGAASDFVIVEEAGVIIGFCHSATWRSPWLLPSVYWHPLLGEYYGGLGPIGIARVQRKRGLGLALFATTVQLLHEAGVERMAIDWTTLIDFYGQLGFKVWKRYLQAARPEI
jgi:GNAT superfamily N-acetyltransferase